LITGLAAFVTSVVAVTGLALNQGWIGGHAKTNSTTGSLPGASAPQATTTGGSGAPTFTVNPKAIVFQPLGTRDAAVTVRNTGLVSVSVEAPVIGGVDTSRFTATTLDCGASLDPGRSCAMKVTFIPAAGTFSANLVVQVVGAPTAVEVPLKASSVL
jgi:hypothetical protein